MGVAAGVFYWQTVVSIVLGNALSSRLTPGQQAATERATAATAAEQAGTRIHIPWALLITAALYPIIFSPTRSYSIYLLEAESTELGSAAAYYSMVAWMVIAVMLALFIGEYRRQRRLGVARLGLLALYAVAAFGYPVYLYVQVKQATTGEVPAWMLQRAIAYQSVDGQYPVTIPYELKINVLTEGHVEALIQAGHLYNSTATSMTDGAAAALGKARPSERDGGEVTELKPGGQEEVQRLTLKLNDEISLESLSVLTADQARLMAQFPGGIRLKGLTGLTPEVAEGLASHPEGALSLEGVTSLDLATAQALGKHKGPVYTSVKTADDPTFAAIVRAESRRAKEKIDAGQARGTLSYHVTSLGEESAKELAAYPGASIDLSSVTAITDRIVDILAARKAPRLRLCNAGLTEAQRAKLFTPPKTPDQRLVEYFESNGTYLVGELYKGLLEKGWSERDIDAALWATEDGTC